mmetsp:Transcript_652/g.1709  ORF Transcript_652/g.1709 Transcript_652/m.1709 type:complete len:158 (-) Transcript_652:1750-2223(-)
MPLVVGQPPPQPPVGGGGGGGASGAGGMGDLLLSFDTPPKPAAPAAVGVGVGVAGVGSQPNQAWDQQGFGLTAAAAVPSAGTNTSSDNSAWANFESAPQQPQQSQMMGTSSNAALALDPALFVTNPPPASNPMATNVQPQMPTSSSNAKDPFADLLK